MASPQPPPPEKTQLQFVPFSSSLHPAFWTTFSKYKLEVLGLKDEPVDVRVTKRFHIKTFTRLTEGLAKEL